eukprot:Pgem_evm1s14892
MLLELTTTTTTRTSSTTSITTTTLKSYNTIMNQKDILRELFVQNCSMVIMKNNFEAILKPTFALFSDYVNIYNTNEEQEENEDSKTELITMLGKVKSFIGLLQISLLVPK